MGRLSRINSNGFTLIETLLAFVICVFIVSLVPTIIISVHPNRINSDIYEDIAIASSQISQYLFNEVVSIEDNEIVYKDEDEKEYTISLDKDRVVKTPGYQIFLYNVSDVAFEYIENCIYMTITRYDHDYKILIGVNHIYEE